MDQYLPLLYYRPNGLKWKDFGDQQETTERPERVVRKDEMEELQIKFKDLPG